jgi:hypothetical protein
LEKRVYAGEQKAEFSPPAVADHHGIQEIARISVVAIGVQAAWAQGCHFESSKGFRAKRTYPGCDEIWARNEAIFSRQFLQVNGASQGLKRDGFGRAPRHD